MNLIDVPGVALPGSGFPEGSGTEPGSPVVAPVPPMPAGTFDVPRLPLSRGFSPLTDGPGSPGHETTKFGALTRAMVRKFQCDKMQICSGDEGTTGYGMVGQTTRDALLAFAGTSSAAATTASASTSSTPDNAAQIAALEKQIADLSAQLLALKQKLGIAS